MTRSNRLTADERRQAILDSARAIFADKGCDAATTRELAEAAGVSEALLYKHFPSKESLFAAICESCSQSPAGQEFERLRALLPGTAALVGMVRLMVGEMVSPTPASTAYRLYLRSLLDDGSFARQFLQRKAESGVVDFYAVCLQAAQDAGDAHPVVPVALAYWLTHHVCTGLMSTQMCPPLPLARSELIQHGVRFILAGLGLTDQAIARHDACSRGIPPWGNLGEAI